MNPDILAGIESRAAQAWKRYGDFASTHEGLGVAVEEWDEFRDAVRANDLVRVYNECLDLAAVLVRIADDVRTNQSMRARSTK